MKNIDIKPRNDKGQAHGHWEVYFSSTSNELIAKGEFHNGLNVGFWDSSPMYTQALTGKVFKWNSRIHIYFII